MKGAMMDLPLLTSDPAGSALGWVWALVAVGAAAHLARPRRIRVRVRSGSRPRPRGLRPFVPRTLSFLGIAIALSSGSAAAGTRTPVSPHRRTSDVAPPWSEAGGFPPPRPLARTGVARSDTAQASTAHPALHRGSDAQAPTAPLFPRSDERSEQEERKAAMRRHPSGKGKCAHHVVKPGESLWSISELVLGTDEPRAIARYWPRLHRANRGTIGPDPRLIRPGQVLQLPSCE